MAAQLEQRPSQRPSMNSPHTPFAPHASWDSCERPRSDDEYIDEFCVQSASSWPGTVVGDSKMLLYSLSADSMQQPLLSHPCYLSNAISRSTSAIELSAPSPAPPPNLPRDSFDLEEEMISFTPPSFHLSPIPTSSKGPIADALTNPPAHTKFCMPSPQILLTQMAANKWLQRSLAQGRPFCFNPTTRISPITQEPIAEWTLIKRLPPGPSRLSLVSPGMNCLASSIDMDEVPEWAMPLVRIKRIKSANLSSWDSNGARYEETGPFHSRLGSCSSSLREDQACLDENKKGRGGVSALLALMADAEALDE